MATLAGRVTAVEGQGREQAVKVDGIQAGIDALRQDMNAHFAGMTLRFDAIDRQFDAVDRRFETADGQFEAIDRKFEIVGHRFEVMDAKVSRQFMWLAGVQVMTLAAVVTSLATILAALAAR